MFLAFGFNWVDAGGLLGGRLDEDIVRVPASAKVRASCEGLFVAQRLLLCRMPRLVGAALNSCKVI